MVRTLAAILRVAIGLDRTHSQRVASARARPGRGALRIEVTPAEGGSCDLELFSATERSGLLAEVLDTPIEVVLAEAAAAVT